MMLGPLAFFAFSPLLVATQRKANDADLVALGQELDELTARIDAFDGNLNSGEDHFEILEVLFEKLEILEREIINTPTVTLAGYLVQAGVALKRFMMWP